MIIFNDLPADIIFVIALLLHPTDLYNLALVANKYARIIKDRKVINYHLKEINEITKFNHKIKYYVFKHTGKKHGLYESWYKNGQKREQINYQNGEKHGLYESWFNDGQKYDQTNYQNDKKHGLREFWYNNERKSIQINYQNNEIQN